ncbi:MAG: IS66 family transposase [Pseudomonadota bacterium]
MRAERSLPVISELRAWLERQLPRVPPKSKLGEALAYLDKYWPNPVRSAEGKNH